MRMLRRLLAATVPCWLGTLALAGPEITDSCERFEVSCFRSHYLLPADSDRWKQWTSDGCAAERTPCSMVWKPEEGGLYR